jgi:hypothetical protein
MGDLVDRVLSTGVTVGQSLAEQRRVRTINVVAVGAFVCTAALTVAFGLLGHRILGETPF